MVVIAVNIDSSGEGQGLGWININDGISCSRSCARGIYDNDDDDDDTINDSGGTEIHQRQ